MYKTIQETLGRILYYLPSIPREAQIEVTNLCNLSCKMCPRDNLDVPFEHIPFDRFKKIVDKLGGVKVLTLTGWGEPFLHPNIFEMIQYSKERNFEVKLTTNGIFKNEAIVPKIIESGLDAISFSIDSPSNGLEWGHPSDVAVKRIKELIKARKGKIPCISLQATIHRDGGNQVKDVIKLCAEVGGDRVNLGRLDTRYVPNMDRPTTEEEKLILKNADRLGNELGVQVDSIQYALSTGVNKLVYRLIKRSLHRMGKYCLKTYSYVYINNAGAVTPCCILPNYSVGNILEENLAQIWQSSRFKDFRANQRKICGKCDLWRIDYFS